VIFRSDGTESCWKRIIGFPYQKIKELKETIPLHISLNQIFTMVGWCFLWCISQSDSVWMLCCDGFKSISRLMRALSVNPVILDCIWDPQSQSIFRIGINRLSLCPFHVLTILVHMKTTDESSTDRIEMILRRRVGRLVNGWECYGLLWWSLLLFNHVAVGNRSLSRWSLIEKHTVFLKDHRRWHHFTVLIVILIIIHLNWNYLLFLHNIIY